MDDALPCTTNGEYHIEVPKFILDESLHNITTSWDENTDGLLTQYDGFKSCVEHILVPKAPWYMVAKKQSVGYVEHKGGNSSLSCCNVETGTKTGILGRSNFVCTSLHQPTVPNILSTLGTNCVPQVGACVTPETVCHTHEYGCVPQVDECVPTTSLLHDQLYQHMCNFVYTRMQQSITCDLEATHVNNCVPQMRACVTPESTLQTHEISCVSQVDECVTTSSPKVDTLHQHITPNVCPTNEIICVPQMGDCVDIISTDSGTCQILPSNSLLNNSPDPTCIPINYTSDPDLTSLDEMSKCDSENSVDLLIAEFESLSEKFEQELLELQPYLADDVSIVCEDEIDDVEPCLSVCVFDCCQWKPFGIMHTDCKISISTFQFFEVPLFMLRSDVCFAGHVPWSEPYLWYHSLDGHNKNGELVPHVAHICPTKQPGIMSMFAQLCLTISPNWGASFTLYPGFDFKILLINLDVSLVRPTAPNILANVDQWQLVLAFVFQVDSKIQKWLVDVSSVWDITFLDCLELCTFQRMGSVNFLLISVCQLHISTIVDCWQLNNCFMFSVTAQFVSEIDIFICPNMVVQSMFGMTILQLNCDILYATHMHSCRKIHRQMESKLCPPSWASYLRLTYKDPTILCVPLYNSYISLYMSHNT
jgi:hypothetical protein